MNLSSVFGISWNDVEFMLTGTAQTILLSCSCIILGTLLGLVVGWIRVLAPAILTWPLGIYVDVVRSVPLVIQFILVNSASAVLGYPLRPFLCGVLVLTTYVSAYCSEIVRAGFGSVPIATSRAARSLGMNYWQTIRHVVAPLGIRVVLPAWIGLVVGSIKDTSLVAVIGMIELLRASQIVITRTHEPLVILTFAGVIYFALCFPISQFGQHIERKMKQ